MKGRCHICCEKKKLVIAVVRVGGYWKDNPPKPLPVCKQCLPEYNKRIRIKHELLVKETDERFKLWRKGE